MVDPDDTDIESTPWGALRLRAWARRRARGTPGVSQTFVHLHATGLSVVITQE